MSFRTFLDNSKRVFLVAKKPTWQEFWNLSKIVAIGIALIGVIGFIITLIMFALYMP